jgi:flagellar protein FlbD
MLHLTRLGGPVFALNPDLIERVDATPDTVITLVGGTRYLVAESLAELTELVNLHRASIIAAASALLEAERAEHPVPARITESAKVVPFRPQAQDV